MFGKIILITWGLHHQQLRFGFLQPAAFHFIIQFACTRFSHKVNYFLYCTSVAIRFSAQNIVKCFSSKVSKQHAQNFSTSPTPISTTAPRLKLLSDAMSSYYIRCRHTNRIVSLTRLYMQWQMLYVYGLWQRRYARYVQCSYISIAAWV